MAKVSGPMLDRFDIMIDVAELPPSELLSPSVAENSASGDIVVFSLPANLALSGIMAAIVR